ncbi:MAG: tetratricopeptide repeat protein [Chitinophagaceae bacterium]|nr:tetratricopeptide repeat protein [Chitinophagaceae bacterium]
MNEKIFWVIVALMSASFVAAQTVNETISKGNEYYKQEQFELAEKQFRRALQLSGENGTAQFNLANALIKQKKYDEAEAVLQKLTSTASDKNLKESAHYNTGVLYSKQKKLDESIEAYKNALRLNPDDMQARENLQKALLEKKKQQQEQQQSQKSGGGMNQNEAEQKLKQLESKEKQIQKRLQNQGKQGNSMPKDW